VEVISHDADGSMFNSGGVCNASADVKKQNKI